MKILREIKEKIEINVTNELENIEIEKDNDSNQFNNWFIEDFDVNELDNESSDDE